MTSGDVLQRLRTATADDHRRVEADLHLMDLGLDRARLASAMTALHAFWAVAEEGLTRWADRCPNDAALLDWPERRRAHVYEADLRALDAPVAVERPGLPDVRDTNEALGRMYVLEGSTLGGTFIDRHLAALPALTGIRVRAFTPYGERTGAMWHAYRRATRSHTAGAGDADLVVRAACDTFAALASWIGAPAGRST